jgi:competence protein ComEA
MVILLLGGLVAAVVVSLLGSTGESRTIPARTAAATAAPAAVVYIHVLGEVAGPGVYQLRDGDRVLDAIAAAGGFTASADQTAVNLARFVSDGEQILVPVQGAAPPVGPIAGEAGKAGGKINLNTASSAELEALPRVGPAMAERIIAWRTANGRFSSIDDLFQVTGIGDKTFEALRELVTV